MFKRLRTKLTVLYAGLFCATLLLISLAVYVAVTRNVEHVVRGELAANGAVFDRIWSLRSKRLHDDADILAHDFGFRAAVATHDVATVRSALDNLRARLGINDAFVVGLDGAVVGVGHAGDVLPASVVSAVQDDPDRAGVFTIKGVAYYGAAAPVMAPALTGVVLFAVRLDGAEMASLERLAAIPLHTRLMRRGADAGWTAIANADRSLDESRVGAFTRRATLQPGLPPGLLQTREGPAAAEIKHLDALASGDQIALLIYYPLNKALAPFGVLLATIAGVAAAGLVLVVLGSWALAATLTKPLSALETAVKHLQRGDPARVEIVTHDEIARLGSSFNAMAEDICDREIRLERAKTLAEAANRAKSAFLANMSHEVRTPLNGVMGVAGVLAGTGLDARQRQMVTIIEDSAATLQQVLCDVLDVARLEAGRFDFVDEPFHLGAAIRRLSASAEIQAANKGLCFNLTLSKQADGWVMGDRVRLEQVLRNLLSNALKFTGAGGIGLTVERSQRDGCTLVVRDTGVGFDPACIETLFQPFVQADASVTRQYGGAGLGLSIARDLARGMKGELTGQGSPGAGAVFTLTLPLAACAPGRQIDDDDADAPPLLAPSGAANVSAREQETPPQPGLDHPADPAQGDPIRILLADDHATNRTVVQLILDSVGVELIAVENGAEAVDAFKAQGFDAVLMDIQMPVMDGLTAVRLIREHESLTAAIPTPVVVLSANAMPEHLESSAAAGADDHLAKPVLAPMLLEALDRALARRDAAEENVRRSA